MSVPVSSEIPYHPCMNDDAHSRVARIHLPVAPRCNTRCGYCERGTLPAEQGAERPGVCEKIMSPEEAVKRTALFLDQWGPDSIVGIAGPGDPLANDETFETMELLLESYPDIRLCLCTNGLNLPACIDRLKGYGVDHLSVTVNGVDPAVVAAIHSFVRMDDRMIKGEAGAASLIDNQLKGIERAVRSGIFVKINSVAVPGINDEHLSEVARVVSEKGAGIMNIMPLIPGGRFRQINPPSMTRMRQLYRECGRYLPVFKKCRQCRADAAGIPGNMNIQEKKECGWLRTA